MRRFIFLFLALVFVLSSCSMLEKVGFTTYKTEYTQLLKRRTKSYTLYRDFSTIAKIKVTHFNKKLFSYYINTTSHSIKDKRFESYLDEFDSYDIYYVAFYTPDFDINNLSDKNSFWNTYLSACGEILRPVSIDSIDTNDWRSNWLISVDMERWAREYVVKFKRVNCRRKILAFSSFLGTAMLDFEDDDKSKNK
ncbi:hypothetical protein [Hippea maritima]|nr:hypothetical protein [Hippea maritima]